MKRTSVGSVDLTKFQLPIDIKPEHVISSMPKDYWFYHKFLRPAGFSPYISPRDYRLLCLYLKFLFVFFVGFYATLLFATRFFPAMQDLKHEISVRNIPVYHFRGTAT